MLNIVWIILISYMLYIGIKLSKFLKFKNYKFKYLLKSFSTNKKGLFLTLGTKIGVGSIIGTATSIFIGGEGAILWSLIFTFITSSIIYYESILGSRYKKQIEESYVGGPYFYLKYGLKNNLTAIISTLLLIVCYSFFFQMIQTNTITNIINLNTHINNIIITMGLMVILLITIFFSIKEILEVLNKIVPFMCVFFITFSLYSIINHRELIMPIIRIIFKSALSFKGIFVGALIGIKRSIFLNETLIGTTSIAASVDDTTEDLAASSQLLGSYFISFIVSVLTAFLILIFMFYNKTNFITYNDLINKVFHFHYGNIGGLILIILITLFALTTLLSGFYIGLSNLQYITKNKYIIFLFKVFMILFSISGIYIDENNIWNVIDFTMMLLIIINIISISTLYKREIYDRK